MPDDAMAGVNGMLMPISAHHPEERALARVSKDEARASWFETALRASSP
jgi:hypothetical protein